MKYYFFYTRNRNPSIIMEKASIYSDILPRILPLPTDLLEIIYDYVDTVLVFFDMYKKPKEKWLCSTLYSRLEYNEMVQLSKMHHSELYNMLLKGEFLIEMDPEKIEQWKIESRKLDRFHHNPDEIPYYSIHKIREPDGKLLWNGNLDSINASILATYNVYRKPEDPKFDKYSEYRDHYAHKRVKLT